MATKTGEDAARLSSMILPGGARPTVNLRLSKFDMSKIPDDCVTLFIGRRGTGKSFLIKDLMWYKQRFPLTTVISGTETANHFYSPMVPNQFIYEEFSSSIVGNIMLRQEKITQKILKEEEIKGVGTSQIDRRSLIIMDDCLYDNKWISDKNIRSLFMNGRHYGLLYILAVQYVMGIPPILRGQVDYVFILRENQVSARKRIYEQFAGIFPTFELFCQIMDQCTENYECLVIHNGCKTNKLEDCVFWYKAAIHPPFKFGNAEQWAVSREYTRAKELAQEAAEAGETPFNTTGTTKMKGPIVQVRKY
jgi:hypothetical protein